jgi:predicted TIM-barrel fold metal-dependent hydrolase
VAFEKLSRVFTAADDYPGLPIVVHGFNPTTAKDLTALAGLAAEHPHVPVVVGQLGGLAWITAIELAQRTPNLWLDLATPIVAFAPALAVRTVPERCLFGTNAPYGDPLTTRTLLERVIDDKHMVEVVLSENPSRLLGMRVASD